MNNRVQKIRQSVPGQFTHPKKITPLVFACLAFLMLMGSLVSSNARANTSTRFSLASEKAFDILKPYIGVCALRSHNAIYRIDEAFDKTLLPYWELTWKKRGQRDKVLLRFMKSRKLSQDDIVAIDVMARTIYAEIDSAFDQGLHYPKALAGIILNRTNSVIKKRPYVGGFIARKYQNKHRLKNLYTQVMLAKKQFSAWNGNIRGKVNPVLSHALCPPVKKRRAFWKENSPQYKEMAKWKKRPSIKELRHWEDAVKISAMAIIDESGFWKNFNKDIKSFGPRKKFDYHFYTSGYYKSGRHRGKPVTLGRHRKKGKYKLVSGPIFRGKKSQRIEGRYMHFWMHESGRL